MKDFTIPAVLLFFVTVPFLAHFPSDYEVSKAEADSVTTLYRENKPRAVSLPEEIQEAKPGDSLKIIAVDQDSIYLGFNNQRNK